MPAGRPKKYTDEVVEEIRLAMEEYIDLTDIPIVAEFAYQNRVERRKLYEFAENNDEFNHTIKRLIDKKEAQLERLALTKEIQHTMAIFSLKQLGWRDITETEHSGSVGISIIDDVAKCQK